LGEGADGDRSVIAGDPFRHVIHRRGIWPRSGPVHVYLEGDGLPWVTRTRVARDPTPRTPLARRLMARDPGPALFLGRPCYDGLAEAPGCSPWLWTQGRYSEAVVRSMAAALEQALGPGPDRDVTLIGYSGGGVLAMLIAARVPRVRLVVTIAANLDIAAWADHHGYSRLLGSLDPAAQPPLPERIRQIHLAGGQDRRVPPWLSEATAARQPNARLIVVPGFDHRCCWERAWPAILAGLDQGSFALDPTALQVAGNPL
jgi:pimeloyl-ACP methyl ester carboxylesterase